MRSTTSRKARRAPDPRRARGILIGPPAQRALYVAFALQDVQHGLHRRVRQALAFGSSLLYSLHISGTVFPERLHDLELSGVSVCIFFLRKTIASPDELGEVVPGKRPCQLNV